jgi:hypothetical protein
LTVVLGLADDVNVKTALPFASGAQVTLRAGGGGPTVLVGVSVVVGVAVAVERRLLKPTTVLPACPVTLTVRHAGNAGLKD